QLYRGAKPVMWSPVEKTALAEAEVEYEDVTSTQIDVAFEITEAPNAPELVGAYAVIWTTTPWTIPANQGIAYGEEIEYRAIYYRRKGQPERTILVAEDLWIQLDDRLSRFNTGDESIGEDDEVVRFLGKYKGTALANATARHPMHHLGGFFAKPRPFLAAPHVTTDAGTGLVHMAPDHGEEDFLACKPLGIDPVFAVQGDGMYRPDWAWLGGLGSVINTKFNGPDGPICTDLRKAGALLAASEFKHSYPHSWRSKARIIFRCTPQWFIPMDVSTTVLDRLDPSLDTNGKNEKPFGSSSFEHSREASVENSTNAPTLRDTALQAISDTRWVPHRATNRIRSMVEGRPDWVISRQRAWGVPIALYVHRQSGEYLNDAAVNARIVEAFKLGGADAWFGADHQALLGADYNLADYEVVNDILDVWFDSGSTHAFVVEANYGADTRADLYLEGSDQHRGWFQSSLLESCGTRGHAPYKAVLTHGFALDGQGRKMSKSLGNVVDPLKIMSESGADILRMWVASTDYFDDVKIGKEVLAGSSDAYRKLRNTFRYLLGALADFREDERVEVADMPELERYMLHRLAELDATLRDVVENRDSESWLEFSRYTRALNDFANIDLSAFFFDIRKDCLYCDVNPATGTQTDKRKAYRTVLDILFNALVRYAAPIIPFTAEEVWLTRFPDAESVHMQVWPTLPEIGDWEKIVTEWNDIREVRQTVNEAIEPLRREKTIGSSLQAKVTIPAYRLATYDKQDELVEAFIVAEVIGGDSITVTPTTHQKCGRCWRHLPEVTEDGTLCNRCDEVLSA
ncbi:MAG: class I tRNA ligase family protein, partial [Sphingobium sp.]